MCSVDNKKGTHWHSNFPFEKRRTINRNILRMALRLQILGSSPMKNSAKLNLSPVY